MSIKFSEVKDKSLAEFLEMLRDNVKDIDKKLPEEFESADIGVNFEFKDGYNVKIKVGKTVLDFD